MIFHNIDGVNSSHSGNSLLSIEARRTLAKRERLRNNKPQVPLHGWSGLLGRFGRLSIADGTCQKLE